RLSCCDRNSRLGIECRFCVCNFSSIPRTWTGALTTFLEQIRSRVGRADSDHRTRGAAPVRGLLPLALGLALWQLFGSPASPYFPVPSEWLPAIGQLWATGRLWPAIVATLTNFAGALLLSVLLGSVLGILLGRSRLLDRLLGPSLEFGRTMPAG